MFAYTPIMSIGSFTLFLLAILIINNKFLMDQAANDQKEDCKTEIKTLVWLMFFVFLMMIIASLLYFF